MHAAVEITVAGEIIVPNSPRRIWRLSFEFENTFPNMQYMTMVIIIIIIIIIIFLPFLPFNLKNTLGSKDPKG